MPKIAVEIQWDEPREEHWLNADNIEIALRAYCKNTNFDVAELVADSLIDWTPCDNRHSRPAVGKKVLALWKHRATGRTFVGESCFQDYPPRWESALGAREPYWQVTHWAILDEAGLE